MINNEIDKLVNMFKCKYDILKQVPVSKYNMIFINLKTILSPIINYILEKKDYSILESTYITSQILSIVGHYRKFFSTATSNKNYVFLYYNEGNMTAFKELKLSGVINDFTLNLYALPPEYYLNNYTNEIKLLAEIIKYVPGVYFIDTSTLDSSILPYSVLMDINFKCQMKVMDEKEYTIFMVSSNKLDYQCANLHSKFYGYKRNSIPLITKENLISNVLLKNYTTETYCNSEFYVFLLSLLGYDKYNIPALVPNKDKHKLIKMLDYNNSGIFSNMESSINGLNYTQTEILNYFRVSKEDYDKNNEVIDLSKWYIENKNLINQNKLLWHIDLIDYSIEELNNKYFNNNKIEIANLFYGI